MYKSSAIHFSVAGKNLLVRALVLSAILPKVGKIEDFPAWLAEQAAIQADAEKAEGAEKAKLEKRLVFPSILEEMLDGSGVSSAFEVQESENAFVPDLEEAVAKAERLAAENEELRQKLADLAAAAEEKPLGKKKPPVPPTEAPAEPPAKPAE